LATKMVSAERALADDHATQINRRVQLLSIDSMRLTRQGADYRLDEPIQLAPPDSPFVAVGQRRGFVRIVSEEYDIRLLVWQPLGNLAEVVMRETRLSLRADRALQQENVGAFVLPGLRVKRRQRSHNYTLVSYSDGVAAIEGWIPSKLLGRVYSLSKPTEQDQPSHTVRLPAEVYASAAAGAKVLARFVRSPLVQAVGDEVGGYQRIVYRNAIADYERGGVVIKGFIKSKLLSPVGIGNGGLGMTGRGGWAGSHVIYLDAGTRLYDSEAGALVGKVLRRVPARGRHYDVAEKRWYSVNINTMWGFAPVWLDGSERKTVPVPQP